MFFYSQTRRFIAWLAIAVMLFASLSPALANAFVYVSSPASESAPASGFTFSTSSVKAPFGEICIASPGEKSGLNNKSGQTEEGPARINHHWAYCGLCLLHSGDIDFLLPLQYEAIPFAALIRAGKPALFYQTPRPLHAWAPPQSRAPPPA